MILNDDSLTLAEKIISVKADGGRKVHRAGEIAVLPAEWLWQRYRKRNERLAISFVRNPSEPSTEL